MFVSFFIDDYSKILEDHNNHLRIVLKTLNYRELYVKFSKCEFLLEHVAFLGHIVSREGIKVDTLRIKAVQNCPRPTFPNDLTSLLGLTRNVLEGL